MVRSRFVRSFRENRPSTALVLVPLALALGGCGQSAVVSADGLPLRKVVLYRNGVAYFERKGKVDDEEVRFKMKQTEVGDFLATLAVMERGGSSVRSASFPIHTDDEVDDVPDVGTDDDAPKKRRKDGRDRPKRPKTEDERRGLKTVVLGLDGKEHDLQVGYVAESPVWRPSYRLVVHDDGNADLQAWGIVQNLSGEDWKSVTLSLVAGAPLAFASDLGTPHVPVRPRVTDTGEVIAAVPRGETSLALDLEAPKSATVAQRNLDEEAEPESEDDDEGRVANGPRGAAGSLSGGVLKDSKHHAAPKPSKKAEPSRRPAPVTAAAPPPPPPPASISAPRNVRSLAAVAAEGGTTRYDIPNPVTVPDRSATMVMLLSRKVPGSASFLFSPDPGVPDSSSHPFRVARFANKTGGLLERGPIAVFEEGSFLGQGLVDPLPDAATATVPFALERAIALESERKNDEAGERVSKIENGQLTIERDSVALTKYKIRNGTEKAAKVIVKHPRMGGARLESPPLGTEDNTGTGSALVPAQVPARANAELVVDERTSVRRVEDWFSPVADAAIKNYFGDAKSNRDAVQKLTAVWTVRTEIVQRNDVHRKLSGERNELAESSEETRRNLRAIEKNKAADALRQKLTARLAELASRNDEVTKQIVELDAKLAELRVRFRDAIRDVRVAPAP
ncbi:MAG: DUF4139 domain-containing protein [Polyangiaceae bacterium]